MWTVKIVTMFGGLARITRRQLNALSELCHAMWFGLMRKRITFFISTRVHLRSHRTTICALLSGGTIKDSAHVMGDFVPSSPYPMRGRRGRHTSLHKGER